MTKQEPQDGRGLGVLFFISLCFCILYKFELKAPQRPSLCVTVSRGEREGRAVAEAGAGAEK